jgi:hypothetical protein
MISINGGENMKKLLGISLLAFVIIVGFSGAAAAQPISSVVSSGSIIDSPGTIIAGGNVVSITGGDTMNSIGSNIHKATINSGAYAGNSVTSIL